MIEEHELRAVLEGNNRRYEAIKKLKRNQELLAALVRCSTGMSEERLREAIKNMGGCPEEM